MRRLNAKQEERDVSMATLTVTDLSGTKHFVDHPADSTTIMRILLENGLDVGLCGGNSSCGTCVARFSSDWLEQLDPSDSYEADLLGTAGPDGALLRLTCMLPFTQQLDGIEMILVPLE